MKNLLILILLILISACGQKQTSKSSLKIYIARFSALTGGGGSYVNLIDKNTLNPLIVKLDASNTATVPYGVYDIIVVVFDGPGDKAGTQHCGAALSTNLNAPDVSLNIDVVTTNCSQAIYTNTLAILLPPVPALWETAKFDTDKWGI